MGHQRVVAHNANNRFLQQSCLKNIDGHMHSPKYMQIYRRWSEPSATVAGYASLARKPHIVLYTDGLHRTTDVLVGSIGHSLDSHVKP